MEQLNQILQLPERCLVNKKITKAFFKRNFDFSLSEKKLLDDPIAIVQIEWMASLKPDNVNIEASINSHESYEEIQVISVLTNSDSFEKINTKIIELIQKYIPYHVLLCVYNVKEFVLNTCSKKINLNDSNKRTIEKSLSTEIIPRSEPTEIQLSFLKSLSFENLDKHTLLAVYDSYSKSITSLHAAQLTGEFKARPIERSKEDVERIELIAKKESEIMQLQHQAKKETQLNLQVKFNAEVQQRRKEIELLKHQLQQ